MELCEACIKWAEDENRVFLRQALQSRLVTVYVDSEQYTAALSIASPLLKELKKIDDKALLVEVGVVSGCGYLFTLYNMLGCSYFLNRLHHVVDDLRS